MEFYLTKEQEMLKKVAREFADREIEPKVAAIEREKKLPTDILEKMGRAKLLGMKAPRKYGGVEAGNLNFALAIEEIGYSELTCAQLMNSNNNMSQEIAHYGTEQHKEKYIRALCEGKAVASLVFTEPATGSDPRAITTTATLDGDSYILNGTKRFASHASMDGPIVIFAKDETGRVSGFILDKNIKGYSVSPQWEMMGLSGYDLVDVYLDKVRIPKENLFGPKGEGLRFLFEHSGSSRLGICAICVGISRAAFDEAVKYAKERIVGGKPIATMQYIQGMLVEMATKIEAMQLLTYKAAFLRDKGESARKEASMAKLFAAQSAQDVVNLAVQVHGSYGYTKDFKVERLYRNIRVSSIYEGSNEIQKTIVASYLVPSK